MSANMNIEMGNEKRTKALNWRLEVVNYLLLLFEIFLSPILPELGEFGLAPSRPSFKLPALGCPPLAPLVFALLNTGLPESLSDLGDIFSVGGRAPGAEGDPSGGFFVPGNGRPCPVP